MTGWTRAAVVNTYLRVGGCSFVLVKMGQNNIGDSLVGTVLGQMLALVAFTLVVSATLMPLA
ncbi:hypothetical protein [Haloarcula amylovorans]|uniref:hypothetical protein n=1 Tax=Haloarcula amylovorans TaxID=2562280 RepID=UPI00107626F3|nr:hypothetical protein [Halomicroarcula amylolytica]